MKRILAVVLAVFLLPGIIYLGKLPSVAYAHAGIVVTSRPTASVPTIDGVLTAGEWSDAATFPFTIQSVTGTAYVMHDATNLYIAAQISDPKSGLNSFQPHFDNDNDGILELGDDALVVNLGDNFAADDYFDGNFLGDINNGGTNDISAFGKYSAGVATFELIHPLSSGDTAHDFSLTPGSVIGFNIVYQSGDMGFYSGFPSLAPFDSAHFGDLVIPNLTVSSRYQMAGLPPGPAPLPGVPIKWFHSGGSGTSNTVFQLLVDGSIELRAPLTYTSGTQIYEFKQWRYGPPQPSGTPLPYGAPGGQSTITITIPEPPGSYRANAIYEPTLGYINHEGPPVNPVGIPHSVSVNLNAVPPPYNVAGQKINFQIDGPNAIKSGVAYIDAATGKATFTYIGDKEGNDTIWAYIDVNSNNQWDGTIYSDPEVPPGSMGRPGEPKSINKINKFWVKNFVTGGGNIKEGKKVTWAFEGLVGVMPEGGAIGSFQIKDYGSSETYNLDQFVVLSFFSMPDGATSPDASHNTARFRGTGKRTSDGATVEIVVMIQDNAEPGGGADKIAAELIRVGKALPVKGLIGSVNVPEDPTSVLKWVTISGGNFQVHDLPTP